jgi:transcriptional regulator with PAS, ATPase and Fis domain
VYPLDDDFVWALARAATEEERNLIRQIVGDDKRRVCILAYLQAKVLGSEFNQNRAAKLLGVSRKTVQRWISESDNPPPKSPGRKRVK